jgi:hypothetical protein
MRTLIVAAIGLCLMALACAAQSPRLPESVNCERDPMRPDEVWERTEAHCLGLLPEIAERNGKELRLTLDNGEAKTFQDVEEGCGPEKFVFERCFVYQLEAYFRIGNSFVVYHGYMECGYYILVDRRSGEEIKLDAMPIYSPNGTWFVSVNDSELCDRPYDVAIWSAASPPQPEFRYAQAKGGPSETWEFVAWDGEDRIKLRASLWDGKDWQTHDTEAVRTMRGWQLKRPWVAAPRNP